MKFCAKCGQQLSDDENFCVNCRHSVDLDPSYQNERKIFFEGEIRKCPSCGNELKAFEAICSNCKFELRSAKSSSAVKDLANKLEQATSEKQQIIIIKNFPIPNTVEDIFEFMILASSNFDASYYATHLQEEDISDAWLIKVEQCYQKAKFMSLDISQITKIETIYNKIITACETGKKQEEQKLATRSNRLKKLKRKAIMTRIVIGAILLFIIGAIIFGCWHLLTNIEMNNSESQDSDIIEIGISNNECEGQYYEDIALLLQSKGFQNIETRNDGWHIFHKSNTIKKITIDGKSEFSNSSKFSKNAKIIIFYYS